MHWEMASALGVRRCFPFVTREVLGARLRMSPRRARRPRNQAPSAIGPGERRARLQPPAPRQGPADAGSEHPPTALVRRDPGQLDGVFRPGWPPSGEVPYWSVFSTRQLISVRAGVRGDAFSARNRLISEGAMGSNGSQEEFPQEEHRPRSRMAAMSRRPSRCSARWLTSPSWAPLLLTSFSTTAPRSSAPGRSRPAMTEPLRVRADALEWREVDGEIVALDLRRSVYLAINPSGALLWPALVEGASRRRAGDPPQRRGRDQRRGRIRRCRPLPLRAGRARPARRLTAARRVPPRGAASGGYAGRDAS